MRVLKTGLTAPSGRGLRVSARSVVPFTALAIFGIAACDLRMGPEVAEFRGTLVERRAMTIRAASLSSRETREFAPGLGPIRAVSGPTQSGVLVVLAGNDGAAALSGLRIAGAEVVATRWGELPPGASGIGVDTTGSRIACVIRKRDIQMPGALLDVGELVIDGVPVDVPDPVLADSPVWSADGTEVFATVLSVPTPPSIQQGRGTGFESWNRIPMTVAIDPKRRSLQPVGVGWKPKISPDGQTLVLNSPSGLASLFARGPLQQWTRIRTGGPEFFAVGVVNRDLLLAYGPVGFSPFRETIWGSMGPRRAVPIRPFSTSARTWHPTLLWVDPRAEISYSPAESLSP